MTQNAKTKKVFDGRYEILSIVGRGARSVVYHARHVAAPHNEVALKVLLEEKGRGQSGERLRKEALALVSSRNRYVVRLDDFHSVGTLCYLSLEYAPEADLRRFIEKSGGKLDPKLAERFLMQTAEALSATHRAGITHRDVKPDNILVMNNKEVRLADFGVAVLPGEESSLKDIQSGIGTMNYMAPEVLQGKAIDQRSDIYALGVTFYEAITGVNPFQKAPLAQQIEVRLDKNLKSIASLVPDLPKHIVDTISRAMSFDPAKRFASAQELIKNLLEKREESLIGVIEAPKSEESKPTTKPSKPQKPKAPRESRERQFTKFVPKSKVSAIVGPSKDTEQKAEDKIVSEEENTAENTAAVDANQNVDKTPPVEVEDFDISEDLLEDTPLEEELGHAQPGSKQETMEDIPAYLVSNDIEHPLRSEFSRRVILTVSILFFLGLFLPGVRREVNDFFIHYFKIDIAGSIQSLAGNSISTPIPNYVPGEFEFPNFASGLYGGSIDNLVPGEITPLSIVSIDNAKKLTFIVGLEGWTPTIIDGSRSDTQGGPTRLRISSNGQILEFTGQAIEGEIFGYFKNILTGEIGEWRVKPQQIEGSGS